MSDRGDKRSRPRKVKAAGGVLWRTAGGGDDIEILLVHRPRYDDWSLPKGKLDPGESWRKAARREIAEETGLAGELGDRVGTIEYVDGKGRDKEVRYYEMAEPEGAFAANDEVDTVAWLSPAAAQQKATRRADADVIAAFCSRRSLS